MERQRLEALLQELELLSSSDRISEPTLAVASLQRISELVAEAKRSLQLNEATPNLRPQERISPGQSQESLGSSIESVLSSPRPSGVGFLDAIRMAANLVEKEGIGEVESSQPSGAASFESATSERSGQVGGHQNHRSVESNNSFSPQLSTGSATISSRANSTGSTDYPLAQQLTQVYPEQAPVKGSKRSKYFTRCFPVYRKLFRHSTQSKTFMRIKQADFVPSLSPDTRHMALVNSSGFQIYSIQEDYNEKPKLKFKGETFGVDDHYPYFVSMNDVWLVVARPQGTILVISLETGRQLFRRDFKYEITALDVSQNGAFLVVALLNHNTAPDQSRAMILLISPSTMFSTEAAFSNLDTVTFASPYKDIIKTVSVNCQESAIVCSTQAEHRLFVVSLADYREPRILLRSSRGTIEHIGSTDSGPGSEGITSAHFFPNSRFILLTSHAHNAPPVVLDTKLNVLKKKVGNVTTQILSTSSQQHQAVVVRFGKLGSAIHFSQPSCRGNGASFVDSSGSVYVANLPSVSTEARKIAVTFEVSPGETMRSAPTLRFSPDGTALIAVDRKGDLRVADFGAGNPGDPGIMKSKVLV